MYGSTGVAASTTVTTVSGTSITLNNNPTASGAATLVFVNPPTGMPDPDAGIIASNPHPHAGGRARMAAIVQLVG